MRDEAFKRDDPAGMPLTRPINYSHSAAPDFFQDLVIAYPPLGVADFIPLQAFFERFQRSLRIRFQRRA
jgi:hypothetical protein